MKKQDVRTCIEDDEEPMAIEVLERHIRQISDFVKRGLKVGLKQETLVVLISDYTKISKGNARQILNVLGRLEEIFLEKRKK